MSQSPKKNNIGYIIAVVVLLIGLILLVVAGVNGRMPVMPEF